MEEVSAIARTEPTAQPQHPDVRATQMNIELFHNVCYIVCGVVVEEGKVLMVQEAKSSCRGQWYLPAGRMERNESIVTAVKREVKEESGMDFEPEALLSVECHAHSWVRFTLGGRIVGGALKTLAEADSESLQAQWLPVDEDKLLQSVHLRSRDILELITIANKWYGSGKPYKGLPVGVGHVSSSLRMVVVHETPSHALEVLVRRRERSEEGEPHLPVCLLSRKGGGINTIVQRTLEECGYKGQFRVVGVLHVEHVGQTGTLDGFCLSVLVRAVTGDLTGGARCRWEEVREGECEERLRVALQTSSPGCTSLIDLSNRYILTEELTANCIFS